MLRRGVGLVGEELLMRVVWFGEKLRGGGRPGSGKGGRKEMVVLV